MKSSLSILFTLLSANVLLAQGSTAEDGRDVIPNISEVRDVVTHDTLSKSGNQNPISSLPKVEIPEGELDKDAKPKKPTSLLSRCIILHRANLATLVPKEAVLHMPKQHESKVGQAEGTNLVPFTEFLASNRAWIKTVEVSRAQSLGEEPIPENISSRFAESTSVVIATFRSGPIAVLPVQEEETSGEEETSKDLEE